MKAMPINLKFSDTAPFLSLFFGPLRYFHLEQGHYQTQILSFNGQPLTLLFPVKHHCLHYIWLVRLCISGLNRMYSSWFVLWLTCQSQISIVYLSAVRHGTFEMKLLVLAETQRSLEMTIDASAELKTALLDIVVLSWFISNWSTATKLFIWSLLRSLATLCM